MKEQEVIKVLTDKLVQVAKWPNMRKEFTVSLKIDSNTRWTLSFYKNEPKMASIEAYTLVLYYAELFMSAKNKMEEEKEQEYKDKALEYLGNIEDAVDQAVAGTLYCSALFHYYEKNEDFNNAYWAVRQWVMCSTLTPEGASEGSFNKYVTYLKHDEDAQYLLDIIDNCNAYMEEQKEKCGEDWDRYVNSVYDYMYSQLDEEDESCYAVVEAMLQLNDIVELPKQTRAKKGSFDYNYAKAEKGDKECIILISKAYRKGDGVCQNIRLADFWEGLANNKIIE